MSVSKRLRYEILRRDNFACTYCGAKAPEVALVVDHVIPVALGGTDHPSNLTAACQPCNSGKSSVPADAAIVDGVAAENLRWAAALRVAADQLHAEREYRERCYDYFSDLWLAHFGDLEDLPDNWQDSVDQFVASGLPNLEVEEAVMIAARNPSRDPWRYCCGVIWRKVNHMREIATAIREDT